jgi:hypothetical protein
MPYAQSLPQRVPPPWGEDGRDQMRAVGSRLDALRLLFTEAVQARLPGLAPADALTEIGRERQLDQGPTETADEYAARLKAAWDIWAGDNTALTGVGGGAGSPLGFLLALEGAGYPTGASGATVVQQCGRGAGTAARGYAQLDASGLLVLGPLMNCANRLNLLGAVESRPGWTFDARDNFWSVFGLLFPATTPVDAAQINALALRWRPAKAVFVGTWVVEAGLTLGWPAGRTLGTDPPLGGNTVTFYPGPHGEAGLMSYHLP